MPTCVTCLQSYPVARASLGYTTCLQCSPVKPVKAGTHYGHKTAGEIDIMPAEQFAKYQKAVARPGGKRCNLSRTARHNNALTY